MAEILKINEAKHPKTVPADIPVANIRWRSGNGWDVSYRPLSRDQISTLTKRGIITLADLGEESQASVAELPHMGPVSARRLFKAAEKAKVNFRGTGFPYEIAVKVDLPLQYKSLLLDIGEEKVREALEVSLDSEESIERLNYYLKEAKLRKLQKAKQEWERKLEEVNASLKEVEELSVERLQNENHN